MVKNIFFISFILVFVSDTYAEDTGPGKILKTMGHIQPNCRMVLHEENTTGIQRWFRIADAPNGNDISSLVMTALVSNRNAEIRYNPGETSGCGGEPRIIYITME